jgi:hypothetical protein
MYYKCSVSTCNNKRTGLTFCSVPCWDAHLPFANHRTAGAVEDRAPKTRPTEEETPHATTLSNANPKAAPSTNTTTAANANATVPVPTRRIVRTSPSNQSMHPTGKIPVETLVIASRLRDYIFARSECNTSGSVYDHLSEHLRRLCDRAIENARTDGRKTVMDRDFEF